MRIFGPLKTPAHRFGRLAIFVFLTALVCANILIAQSEPASPEDPTAAAIALFNKGQEFHEKGDLNAALYSYKQALELVPEFPEAELQSGNALLSLGRTDEAEKAFRRALVLRPDWTLAMANLGSIMVDKGLVADAERILTRAIELDTQNFPAFAALASLRLRTRAARPLLEDLLSRLVKLSAKSKPPASIWSARASVEFALGMPDAARRSAERARALDPANRLSLALLFDIAIANGDSSQAAELILRYEKLSADPARVAAMRARLLSLEGKSADALAVLNGVKQPDAEIDDLRNRISLNQATSAADLEQKLASAPNDVIVLGRLCMLLRAENPLRALDYCRRASELESGNINYAIGFGAALVQAKRFTDATALFRKLAAAAPENATIRANLATAYFEQKLYAEAKPEYQWLTSNQPQNAAAWFFLALVYDHLGEFTDALANYQQFLKVADKTKLAAEIERVTLRLPAIEKLIKEKAGKSGNAKR